MSKVNERNEREKLRDIRCCLDTGVAGNGQNVTFKQEHYELLYHFVCVWAMHK